MDSIQLSFFDSKRCPRCGEWKPRSEFPQNRSRKDGLAGQCKFCASASAMESHKRHPEMIRRARRNYENSHKQERLALGRLRTATNPRLTREWHDLLDKYGHRCAACGALGSLVPDHIVPLTKGGSTLISNIQPLCSSCNNRKRNKIIDYR